MEDPKESKCPRIAFYLNHLEIGGAEHIAVELGSRFVKLGFNVDFVLVQAKGALLPKVSKKTRIVDLAAPTAYLGFPSLLRYIQKESPDALLAVTELTGILAVLSKIFLRSRHRVVVALMTTVSRHKRLPIKKKIERMLLSLLYPKADGIVAVSRGVARDFTNYIGIRPDRIKVIYSPIITSQLLEEVKMDVNHPFLQPDQPPVILGVGRLSESKNFPLLIEAFALVRRNIPARLLIVGEGEERPALEALINSIGLSEEVSLPGFVHSPLPYMNKASVFVLSSLWEGLPSTLIEALACGAPVVSTDCESGPSEILDGGKYGHLVKVDDVEALASAIEASLNGDLRSKPSPEWLNQFRVETVAQEYLKVLGLTA
jgi:glycosyltransferase involved in cell wall biosynthesis